MRSPTVPPAAAADPDRPPTRRQAVVFRLKTWLLCAARVARDQWHGRPERFSRGATASGGDGPILAEARSPLYPGHLPAEFALQAGKVQNLRVAAARLGAVVVPAGAVFSFWAHVPRPTRRAGFAEGRELREGCVVPSIGGGLCQLSNALYDCARRAGCEIVERHAHSRRLPGSMAEAGRDATVFWNYVDLRFRPPGGCRIEVGLTRDELVVRFRALGSAAPGPKVKTADHGTPSLPVPVDGPEVESCETCGVVDCFRHSSRSHRAEGEVSAWLVDSPWPEFDRYLRDTHRPDDWLLLPLDGQRYRLRSYGWSAGGYARVRQAPLETLRRSWTARRLAAQGAARQRALLGFDAALAARYARNLPARATHLVVSQNLLPFLWRAGTLGGRRFDVLMTRLPLTVLQTTLDRAAARHPDSPTLGDFRVDPALAELEAAALAEAGRWITPHAGIARLAGSRAHRLSWQMPGGAAPTARPPGERGDFVWFPASTLGRKGAYELRDAARELSLRVKLGGPVLEGPDFWRGVETLPATTPEGRPARAAVLPAWVEHQPRRLLLAAASGVPVIASEACGLGEVPGVTLVPTGSAAALREALR